MKKLLLVIVLMFVAMVFISSGPAANGNYDADHTPKSKVGFEDFGNSDLAPPWGPVHP